jgi:hypothetical protein
MAVQELKELESIKNLLIISLLKSDVTPEAIAMATGIPVGTLRRKFQMKSIKQ